MKQKLVSLITPVIVSLLSATPAIIGLSQILAVDGSILTTVISAVLSLVLGLIGFSGTVLFDKIKELRTFKIVENVIKQAETLVNKTGPQRKDGVLTVIHGRYPKGNIEFISDLIDILVPNKKLLTKGVNK